MRGQGTSGWPTCDSAFTARVLRQGVDMTAISIQVEGQAGLTWPRWKRMVAEVEDLGFAGLFRSDHFTMPAPPDEDALELMVSLAYLADHSRRLHFGSLVAPLTFRHP